MSEIVTEFLKNKKLKHQESLKVVKGAKGDKGDALKIVHGVGEPGNIEGDLYIDDSTGDLWLNV